MSKEINVNPGNYKEGGRERPGQDILHEVNKQQYTQAQKAVEENSLIPNQHQAQNQNAEQHPETPATGGGENDGGNATPSSNDMV